MFRDVARKKQALTREECQEILKQEVRGVLSVIGDDGYPYGLPINYWYDEKSETLYFHSGKKGHKIDALRRDDKVSFCVYEPGCREEGEWWLNIRSVICFGRLSEVTDFDQSMEISRQISYRFPCPEEYIRQEIEKDGKAVLCLEMRVEHMTGKRVTEK